MIYVCYSRKDDVAANYILRILESGGYTCFIDTVGIESGDNFQERICTAIESCDLFIFLHSNNSANSRFCSNELRYAIVLNKPILVIRLDDRPLLEYLYDRVAIRIDTPKFENLLLYNVGKVLGYKSENLTEEKRKKNLDAAEKRRNGDESYEPKQIDVDIFISYRRVDGVGWARNIMQGLKIVGYPKVFFDYHTLHDGVFNTQILDAIYSCKDFILVISPLALKNCSREGDWVAKEIRYALKYNKKIIPVVIEDTFNGWPADFPEDLSSITDIHFHKLLTDEYFEDSIGKLAKRLSIEASPDYVDIQDFQTIKPVNNETICYKIKVDKDCKLYIDDEVIQTLKAGQLSKIPLPKGEYVRKVVDVENEQIFNEAILVAECDKVEMVSLQDKKSFWKRLF